MQYMPEFFISKRMSQLQADAPVGIFDSGIGGLSVVRHLRKQLPQESLLYFADSAYNPYGDRDTEWLAARSIRIAEYLFARGAKALVVACNTATAAAIHAIRSQFPHKIVIGLEPGLKPAIAATNNGHIGVLATSATLRSEKFAALCKQLAKPDLHFHLQACPGLADRIEHGELQSPQTLDMVRHYLAPLLDVGCDSLVLGCTHYPFVADQILNLWQQHSGNTPALIDTGEAVIRHLRNLLNQSRLLNPATSPPTLCWLSTGQSVSITEALRHLLPEADSSNMESVSL
ncbi:glutamate racemase [Undibacterium squillarum]|uniref:Glutamate racemase n=1 Tax=Undibacterium squillarum TaxID=1131567 RepID=A0ABQ2XSY8_9BURK|nr:glutamate racemase [Undibacterium squillarum]GGX30637.1 glutamate racemase [Undibacterium squillarum]